MNHYLPKPLLILHVKEAYVLGLLALSPHVSVIVNILYGIRQEYCNMLLEDALKLLTRKTINVHSLTGNICLANELKEIDM